MSVLTAADIAIKLCDGPGCPVTELTGALSSRGLSWPIMIYEGGSHLDDQNSQSCVDLTIDANSCLVDVYQSALDDWRDLDIVAGYNLADYIFFDQSGRQALNASGNLFGHRGSNEGIWPKETALLEWDDTPGNECWWSDCAIPIPEPGRTASMTVSLLTVMGVSWIRRRRDAGK